VISLSPTEIARAARAGLVAGSAARDSAADAPARAIVDSRQAGPGDLFVGLTGQRADGGAHAPAAIEAGAWGAIVGAAHAGAAAAAAERTGARVFESPDPLAALGALAGGWIERLREHGCRVIGITGSTGKTSTKDILLALARPPFEGRVHANRENFNTEVGLPLTVLEAEEGTRLLVLEMAMRGMGQIRDLARTARPDVGVITNIGPVHLELVGTVERVAEAKAELIAELRSGAVCVVPAAEEALHPHLRSDVRTLTFARPAYGEPRPPSGGRTSMRRPEADSISAGAEAVVGVEAVAGAAADVRALAVEPHGEGLRVEVAVGAERATLEFNFSHAHNVANALAAIGALHALEVPLPALGEGAGEVRFSSLRGEILELPGGVVVVNDCYNANPVSMRAALEHLAAVADRRGAQRVVAVLGDMRELGPAAAGFHREAGGQAAAAGVELLLAVGDHAGDYVRGFGGPAEQAPDAGAAAELAARLVRPGDVVLVKASRGVGLERVTEGLQTASGPVS
jgi:UDP-N-acetylmuramoyl-tripeptide--D-alanyl-D-alanine ligase